MSDFALFCCGIVVFAITVGGAVTAGGLAFTRYAKSDDLRDALNAEARLATRPLD